MHDSVARLMDDVKAKNPAEPEFHQAVEEVAESLDLVFERHPEYKSHRILERIIEPERVILFRVPWADDRGEVQVNRGFRIEMNSALGPYKGGLRFHASVNLGILKFLAFEQVFKNSLTTLPMGGGKGGSDFDPKGKSDNEVMRFCQSVHVASSTVTSGPTRTSPPATSAWADARSASSSDSTRSLANQFSGVLTGKGLELGRLPDPARGHGLRRGLLRARDAGHQGAGAGGQDLPRLGQRERGPVHGGEAARLRRPKVVTLSDSNGSIYDEAGIDREKLAWVMDLKNVQRGRISAYADQFPGSVYTATDASQGSNTLWSHPADCAFPCATQNEINLEDARNLLKGGVTVVSEGANMPTTADGVQAFLEAKILYGPGKAANAGGVAVSGLEMAQNSMRYAWTREEVDNRLQMIMGDIHTACVGAAERFGTPGNYVNGANIAGFLKVADSMIDQGLV